MEGLVNVCGEIVFKDDLEKPIPMDNEVLCQVYYAGICATDKAVVKGYKGYEGILGHEWVGKVIKAKNRLLEGRLVTGSINYSCGHCSYCQRGLGNHCKNRVVPGILNKDGVFTEYITVPEENLILIEDGFPITEGIFIEPVAAAIHVLDEIKGVENKVALIGGKGNLGSLINLALKAGGLEVDIYNREDNPRGEKYAYVVEASGSEAGFKKALDLVDSKGKVIFKTTYMEEKCLDFAKIMVEEISLVGSRCGDLQKAYHWILDGKIDLSEIDYQVFSLEDYEKAFQYKGKGIFKIKKSF